MQRHGLQNTDMMPARTPISSIPSQTRVPITGAPITEAPVTGALLACAMLTAALLMALTGAAHAQTDQRWYQIEVTLFAHSNAMLAQEHWPEDALSEPLADTIRPLASVMDILMLPAWSESAQSMGAPDASDSPALPEPAVPLRSSDFRLPDFERDPFLALLPADHGFSDSNRALNASAAYRVLYHNAWRQPVTSASAAVPIRVIGGERFGDHHELEGSLTVRFNPGQDRVVLDARLSLTEFAWQAETDGTSWQPASVIPILSSREMRSNEFHYVDHPAVGILVHVAPYTVPPATQELQVFE